MNQDSNSQKWFRGVVGIGLSVMIATYVISIKTDLFQADVADDVMNGAITAELGDGLFAAANTMTEEGMDDLAPAAEEMTGEDGVMPAAGTMTGEEAEPEVVEPVVEIPEPVVVPEPVVIPDVVAPAAPEPVIVIPEPVIVVPDVVAVEAQEAEMQEVLPDTGLNNYVVVMMLIVFAWVALMVRAKTSKE